MFAEMKYKKYIPLVQRDYNDVMKVWKYMKKIAIEKYQISKSNYQQWLLSCYGENTEITYVGLENCIRFSDLAEDFRIARDYLNIELKGVNKYFVIEEYEIYQNLYTPEKILEEYYKLSLPNIIFQCILT